MPRFCVLPCSCVLCLLLCVTCVFGRAPRESAYSAVLLHVLPSVLPCTYVVCRAPMCTAVLLCVLPRSCLFCRAPMCFVAPACSAVLCRAPPAPVFCRVPVCYAAL
eukprot:5296022-Pyramimonas_sp.AAC.1